MFLSVLVALLFQNFMVYGTFEIEEQIINNVIVLSIFFLTRYLMISLMNYVFSYNTKIFKTINDLFSGFVVAFVILSIPILIYLSLFSINLSSTATNLIAGYMLIVIVYFYLKLIYNNSKSVLSYPIYSAFYLITIEIIPLFLLFHFFLYAYK